MAAVLQHRAGLFFIEGDLFLGHIDFPIDFVAQTLDRFAGQNGFFHNLFAIVYLHLGVKPALGLDAHQRPHLAEAVAAAALDAHLLAMRLVGQIHLAVNAFFLQQLNQPSVNLQRAAGHAASSRAHQHFFHLGGKSALQRLAEAGQLFSRFQHTRLPSSRSWVSSSVAFSGVIDG